MALVEVRLVCCLEGYVYCLLVNSMPSSLISATQMTGDAIVHTVWGPRKKSWGIQMTLMSSLMRNAGQHTDLMDIVCDFFMPLLPATNRL